MRFWIECTRFETGQPYHVNISLVGGMWRDGERTILAFVGSDAQKVEVKETPGTDPGACISARGAQRRNDGDAGQCRSGAQPICARVGAHPDYWYPAAWSRELKAGKTFAASFAGEPIVLVRPIDGPVFALEDRCAHRQVPLSKGVVDGCSIRCCYHGWRYDGSGRCIDVPYLGKGKLPNGVRVLSLLRARRHHLRVAGHGAGGRSARAHRRRRRTRLQDAPVRQRSCSATTPSCTRT